MFGHDNQDGNRDEEVIHNDGGLPDSQPEEQDQAQAASSSDDSQDSQDNGGGSGSGFVPTPAAPASTPPPAATDDLLDIKQEALEALTPLVGQLDQTPEEQFRTTMMMIQASDNHALVKVAYDAAKQISNEKERAQALLDIVNEINYFTQHVAA